MTNKLPVVEKKSLQVELSKEVLKAMEDLREDFKGLLPHYEVSYYQREALKEKIIAKAEYLLNTVDNQFNSSEVEEDCPNEQAALDWNTEVDYSGKYKVGYHDPEQINEIKPKESIWKPVSELLKNDTDILLRYPDGEILLGYIARDKIYANIVEDRIGYIDPNVVALEIDYDEIEVCTISDFINQHNALLDRVERLEQIIGDKII